MKGAGIALSSASRFETAQMLARAGQAPFVTDGFLTSIPGMSGWTAVRRIACRSAANFPSVVGGAAAKQ